MANWTHDEHLTFDIAFALKKVTIPGFRGFSESIDHDSDEKCGEWRDVYDRRQDRQNCCEKQALVSCRQSNGREG